MKRIFVLIGLISLFLFTSGCTSARKEEIHFWGSDGISAVAKKGARVIEKTWREDFYGIHTPKLVVVSYGDTVHWMRVPGDIYNKYNVGDTIKPL